jgi:fatty acid desaturase
MTASNPIAPAASPAPSSRWHDAFSHEEIRELVRMRDWRSWLTLAVDWGMIAGAMALAASWTNPLTIVAALVVIGTRQLGLAVIMHEAAHRTFFSDPRTNDSVVSWLACYPIWSDLYSYRDYHMRHHGNTWTEKDPDLHLATPFPITRASFRRKVGRDLSGRTGIKFLRFAARRDLGSEGTLAERLRRGLATPRFRGMLITNAALLAAVTLAGHAWLYLLWIGAYLTWNTLVTRIRSIAEHSMTPDPTKEMLQTRTTLASFWERLLIAPNRVNYHLEHHLHMAVPHYNLPRMHRMLRERGLLDGALVARGYAGVLRSATSATPTAG